MTWLGLRRRWHVVREQCRQIWTGPPHGCDPQIDIDRRLTHTPIALIFDVGANRGQSAVRFRRFYPSATLHCFEPAPATFAHLQQTVSGWPRVHTHMCALGASRGSGELQLDPGDDRVSRVRSANGGGVRIETVDNIADELGVTRIDYLKIDAEGQDLAVLEGARRLLGSSAIALIEVEAAMHRENTVQVSAITLDAFLEDLGYRLFGVYEQTLEWPTADAHLRRANLVYVSGETIRRNHWSAHATRVGGAA